MSPVDIYNDAALEDCGHDTCRRAIEAISVSLRHVQLAGVHVEIRIAADLLLTVYNFAGAVVDVFDDASIVCLCVR